MKLAIVIPARYGSTRFPGKPLVNILGKSMLRRVCEIALHASMEFKQAEIQVIVATDDQRIYQHVEELGLERLQVVMTQAACKTGSDRVYEVISQLKVDQRPDYVLNFQGDSPLTPPKIIRDLLAYLIDSENNNTKPDVLTPVVQLSWPELDQLRANKKITPFSGTVAIIGQNQQALWFSKTIIPAIRGEENLRQNTKQSPVHQHIGLYAYRLDVLERFMSLPEGHYEKLEGLEQLRLLENNIAITAITIALEDSVALGGIDTPEDVIRVESHIKAYGELI